ncbi:MAG: sigma-54-dependent Fis family transcriptional regulator, partial [Gemmatimonadetes bacterium]|nr:sigma-54-dependent Fis family transcriptional regulator [Gemmatimonadota bacterium]
GESGTGKELVARAIHFNGPRQKQPFISENCAAIPETLLESELFGYERGAFTGAVARKIGKFEQANGGTIFLDEIGDMSLSIQAKVLRVLQEQTFERVGGRETITVNTRVVAATNKSLVECMKSGTFRVDLFYRLKVVSIFLPGLRERGDDVMLLANYFLQKYNYQLVKNVRGLSSEAVEMVQQYDWPGNVRELENNVQTAVLLNKSGILSCEDFPIYLERKERGPESAHGAAGQGLADSFRKIMESQFGTLAVDFRGALYDRLVQDFERALISLALEKVGGNQVRASKLLGISRNTLRNRIERFGQGAERAR